MYLFVHGIDSTVCYSTLDHSKKEIAAVNMQKGRKHISLQFTQMEYFWSEVAFSEPCVFVYLSGRRPLVSARA